MSDSVRCSKYIVAQKSIKNIQYLWQTGGAGEFIGHHLCARTRKKRLEDVVPYVPGSAGTQLIKSVLDSSIIVTGPPPSFGITTELLGVKLSDDVVCIVQNELTE